VRILRGRSQCGECTCNEFLTCAISIFFFYCNSSILSFLKMKYSFLLTIILITLFTRSSLSEMMIIEAGGIFYSSPTLNPLSLTPFYALQDSESRIAGMGIDNTSSLLWVEIAPPTSSIQVFRLDLNQMTLSPSYSASSLTGSLFGDVASRNGYTHGVTKQMIFIIRPSNIVFFSIFFFIILSFLVF